MGKKPLQKNTVAEKQQGRILSGFTLGCLAVSLLLMTVAVSWNVVAKYVTQRQDKALVVAEDFYFTSNYLTEKGITYTINPVAVDNIPSVEIQLRNYDGSNKSGTDFTYDIFSDGGAKLEEQGNADRTMKANTEEVESFELSGMQPGKTYTVTAESKSGYYKKLSATFVVNPVEQKVYMNVKYQGEYILLTVWTQAVSGVLSITPTNFTGLIQDMTDDDFAFIGQTMGKYQSHSFRYFKGSDYTAGSFTVKVDDIAATETTLN